MTELVWVALYDGAVVGLNRSLSGCHDAAEKAVGATLLRNNTGPHSLVLRSKQTLEEHPAEVVVRLWRVED